MPHRGVSPPPKQHHHEKNPKQISTEEHSPQITCPVLLKTAKFIKNKESLRNCHGPEEVKET